MIYPVFSLELPFELEREFETPPKEVFEAKDFDVGAVCGALRLEGVGSFYGRKSTKTLANGPHGEVISLSQDGNTGFVVVRYDIKAEHLRANESGNFSGQWNLYLETINKNHIGVIRGVEGLISFSGNDPSASQIAVQMYNLIRDQESRFYQPGLALEHQEKTPEQLRAL